MFDTRNIFIREGCLLSGSDELQPSEYQNVRIEISGLYGWEIGYYNNVCADYWVTKVMEAFEKEGFTIEPPDDDYSCARLHQEGTNLDLYMHPMEFTGAATKEQQQKILEIFRNLKPKEYYISEDKTRTVSCKAVLVKASPLYDLTGNEYRNMIYSDAENIAKCILTAVSSKEQDGKTVYSIDYQVCDDFVTSNRLDRTEKHSTGGYSSSDIDYAAVNDIRECCVELLNKGVPMREIPKMVEEKAIEWTAEIEVIQEYIKETTKDMNLEEKWNFYYGLNNENDHKNETSHIFKPNKKILELHIKSMNLKEYLEIGKRQGIIPDVEKENGNEEQEIDK